MAQFFGRVLPWCKTQKVPIWIIQLAIDLFFARCPHASLPSSQLGLSVWKTRRLQRKGTPRSGVGIGWHRVQTGRVIRSLKLVGTVALAKPDRMLVGKAARDSSALLLVWTSESHLRRNEDKHEAAQQPESATYLSESTMTNPAAQLSQGRADTDRACSANGFGSPQMIVSMSGGS